MTPADPRHGTNAGYGAGCRLECCRTAHAVYRRSVWRKRYVRGVDALYVDATGTIRRVRALQAMGWRFVDIDHAVGRDVTRSSGTWSHNLITQQKVHVDNVQLVREAYDRLSMSFGPSEHTRRIAEKKGWYPPLAWDDETIDDPTARPRVGSAARPKKTEVDDVVVERAMRHDFAEGMTTAERREVTRRWLALGRSTYELERVSGWKSERYVPREAGAA